MRCMALSGAWHEPHTTELRELLQRGLEGWCQLWAWLRRRTHPPVREMQASVYSVSGEDSHSAARFFGCHVAHTAAASLAAVSEELHATTASVYVGVSRRCSD